MNYYIPYFNMTPNVVAPIVSNHTSKGFFAKLLGGLNWSSILNNTQKTLGIVNQTIPMVKQISPIMKKIGPKINSAVGKKPAEEQPVIAKPAEQYNNTVKKNKAVTGFKGYLTNYSTGMRV